MVTPVSSPTKSLVAMHISLNDVCICKTDDDRAERIRRITVSEAQRCVTDGANEGS